MSYASNAYMVDFNTLHELLGEELYHKARECLVATNYEPTKERFPKLQGEQRNKANELADWWNKQADAEIEMVVAKAIEYGATDLRDIGRDLAECMGRKVSDEEAVELGIYFYVRGKLSRWTDAIKRGDRVSDDTILDVGVYTRMAQRTRQVGGWPNKPG